MIRDIIDRFSYRFELWRRQQPPDYFGVQRTAPADLGTKLAKDPKRRAVLTESTPMFIARGFGACFSVIGIVAIICRVFITFFPTARLGIIIGFITFACLWLSAAVVVSMNLRISRKRFREEETNHLTNR